MSRRRIGIAKATLPDLPTPEFIELAAETGFDFVSLRLKSSERGREGERLAPGEPGFGAALAALGSTGLEVLDLEFLTVREDTRDEDWGWMLGTGEALGARYLNLGSRCSRRGDLAAVLSRWAAARSSIAPLLEAIRFYSDLGYRDMVAELERGWPGYSPHARPGLLLDTMQLARVGELEAIEALAPHVRVIQLCDAPLAAPEGEAGLEFEARYARIPPGEGGLPLARILAALPADLPVSVECPNRDLERRLGPRAFAARLLSRARDVLAGGAAPAAVPARGSELR